jgi:branched-chain amino acid transport system ATP-binding protein
MSSLLELRGVTATYGGNPVVDGVCMNVGDGELVALLGSNGAGKTTLLKAVSGLVPMRAGDVIFHNVNLTNMPPHQRARHGLVLVPEGRRIFPDFTVLENLQAGALARNGRADQEQDMRRVFSLFPVLEQKQELAAASLSGGEQQMLAIGRALMSAPRLLMIDEPSLGLSPIVLRDLYNVLALLAGSGLAVLLAEQNLRAALRVAQRGYVLRHGEIVFQGSASELRNRTDLPELYLGKAVFKEEG